MSDYINGKPAGMALVFILIAGCLSLIRLANWNAHRLPTPNHSVVDNPNGPPPGGKANPLPFGPDPNARGIAPNPNSGGFPARSDPAAAPKSDSGGFRTKSEEGAFAPDTNSGGFPAKSDPGAFAPDTGPGGIPPKVDPDLDRALDPNFLKTGVMQAWYGQEKELAANCDRALKQLKDTDNPAMAERAAKICSLRPMDDKIHETALTLARRAVEVGKSSQFLAHFYMALGMAEYRVHNYQNADAALIEASRLAKDNYYVSVTAEFYRSMSLFRQKKEAESRKVAQNALAKMKPLPTDERNPLIGKTNIDDLILWMAYKEANGLLKLRR